MAVLFFSRAGIRCSHLVGSHTVRTQAAKELEEARALLKSANGNDAMDPSGMITICVEKMREAQQPRF